MDACKSDGTATVDSVAEMFGSLSIQRSLRARSEWRRSATRSRPWRLTELLRREWRALARLHSHAPRPELHSLRIRRHRRAYVHEGRSEPRCRIACRLKFHGVAAAFSCDALAAKCGVAAKHPGEPSSIGRVTIRDYRSWLNPDRRQFVWLAAVGLWSS